MSDHPTTEVDIYRAKVVAWLKRKEFKWRSTAASAPAAAADAASFYAAAYMNAAQGILDGDPEKRAAMEDRENGKS